MAESDIYRYGPQNASTISALTGGDDRAKRKSVARHRYLYNTKIAESEAGTGVHQFNTWEDFVSRSNLAGMRTKDIRRMRSNFEQARSKYQNRMLRHQEQMRGAEITRSAVARRAFFE